MFMSLRKRTRIDDLADGKLVVVEGRVVARSELNIMGSDEKGVYFDRMNESFEKGQRGAGRRMWVPKNMERKSAGFFIDDGSGSVWIADDVDATVVSGGKQIGGVVGKKGRARFSAQVIQEGNNVRVRGVVSRAKGAEPSDGLVIRANAKGRLEILVC
jgi:hypothetical protein